MNNKIYTATIAKGTDGTMWYTGATSGVKQCKTNDLCLDGSTMTIYKCTAGGSNFNGQWEEVCNLPAATVDYILDTVWWFGTKAQYNALTDEELNSRAVYFIQEGS